MKRLTMVWFAMAFIVATAFGQRSVWDPVGGGIFPPDTGDWMNASNWTESVIPTGKATFNVAGAADCLLTNVTTLTGQLSIGDVTPVSLGNLLRIGDGGNLTVASWCAIGYNASGRMIVEPGAVVNIGTHLWISFLNNKGPGPYDALFINNGGEVNIGEAFGIQRNYSPPMAADVYRGRARLNGGITRCSRYYLGNPDQAFAHGDINLDIAGGLFKIEGDRSAKTQEYIDAGLITGYGGLGTVHYEVTPDSPTMVFTTVWAEWGESLVPPNALQVDYYLDDSRPDKTIGRGARGDIWVANSFTAQEAGEVIVSVEASFDHTMSGPLGVHLYDDPNDDGIPDDLVLLRSVQTSFPVRGACHTFPIPPTEVTGLFFVALSYPDRVGGNDHPLLLDITSDQQQTWYVETSSPGTLNPARLPSPILRQSSVPGYGGQYLIRATGVPKPVPIIEIRSHQQTGECGLTWGAAQGAYYEIVRATDLGLEDWIILDADRVHENALTRQLTVPVDTDAAYYRARRTTPPVIFEEDFEAETMRWFGTWEIGAVANDPYSAHSGGNVCGTNLDGNYSRSVVTTSPPIELPDEQAATVSFWYVVDTPVLPGDYDRLVVEMVEDPSQPLLQGELILESRGTSTWMWTYAEYLLPQSMMSSTRYLRFILFTDRNEIVARGAYIDDVSVRVSAPDSAPTPPGFSLIPADTFLMGSPTNELGRYTNETQHQVTLTRDLFLQKTEVTNQQMADVLNWALGQGRISVSSTTVRNLEGNQQELLDLDESDCQITWDGSRLVVDAGKDDYPCILVTWYGAQAYCNYLSDIEALDRAVDFSDWSWTLGANGYRLPTESEWEYACRAGTTTAFYTGPITYTEDDPVDPSLDRAGWFWGNSTNPDNPLWEGRDSHAVGLKEPNARGLYDMHGNVWEWCGDWYGKYPGSVSDPDGAISGPHRVVRGGSWSSNAMRCRSAFRGLGGPDVSYSDRGFRPARSVDP